VAGFLFGRRAVNPGVGFYGTVVDQVLAAGRGTSTVFLVPKNADRGGDGLIRASGLRSCRLTIRQNPGPASQGFCMRGWEAGSEVNDSLSLDRYHVRNQQHDSSGIPECTSQVPLVQEIGDFCGRMVVQELRRDSCSVEYASTFHRKDLSLRIKVIFILYGVA
jgi:hypothetical protein